MLFTSSVEGTWATWNAWGACSGGTRSRIRTHANGNAPCSGTNSETGSCGCSNPNLSISFEDGPWSGPAYEGVNVLTDNEGSMSPAYYHHWMSDQSPSKLRILFSCAKEISVVNIRNSGKGVTSDSRYILMGNAIISVLHCAF